MVDYIKTHPYQAMILALAAGALLARLLGFGDGFDDSYLH